MLDEILNTITGSIDSLAQRAERDGYDTRAMIAVVLIDLPTIDISLKLASELRDGLVNVPGCPDVYQQVIRKLLDMGTSPMGTIRMLIASRNREPYALLFKRGESVQPCLSQPPN